MKSRDGDYEYEDEEALVKELESFEFELFYDEVKYESSSDEDEDDTSKESFAACTFEEIYDPVDDQADEDELNGNDP